ncbi:nucleoside-diphosphate kinase [Muribacter muris]|uniref:Nucleoside diphosphate kinase n=1 Tax=Muribacter muris TaxID=67855 RepID=A0A4Y9JWL7_9PAST|nr:nucleoside-diphosphate kinase [Muribacter muris]MBF0785200.1 nucleoside-diphosphate kinase [Muribacter muris]MBF0827386.1 nucleoside-diphosphate kinase [Muribacter muris]TFV10151.1 nucleoside-diphosphate kinase [Muribacter muris]
MKEQTLAIIKPDMTSNGLIGEVISHIEKNGLAIKALKMVQLTTDQAEGFYAEHQGKAFFDPLIAFMTSAPVVVAVLEGENAVQNYRELMGATLPEQRKMGTIRKMFGQSTRENAVHGSDSIQSAAREIAYFFTPAEIIR